MKIQYNIPFEVTESMSRRILIYWGGIVAHRREEGKFLIKVLMPQYTKRVQNWINNPINKLL